MFWLAAGADEDTGEKSMRGPALGFQLVLVVAMAQRLGREVPSAWTEASGAWNATIRIPRASTEA